MEKISMLVIDGPIGNKVHIALSQFGDMSIEKTHCGVTSENWYFGGHICSTDPKAVLEFAKEGIDDIPLCDECAVALLSSIPPRVGTIGREATPEEMAAVVALANSGDTSAILDVRNPSLSEEEIESHRAIVEANIGMKVTLSSIHA